MTRIFLFIIIGLILSFYSCESNKKVDNPSTPTTIIELQSSFNNIELTPEINEISNTSVVIITTGHLYPLLGHPVAYKTFVSTILSQNPDYVFILGDVVYNNTQKEWDLFFDYFKDLKEKLYFAPGNHDLNFHYERYYGKHDHQFEAEQRYIDNVGYRYFTL